MEKATCNPAACVAENADVGLYSSNAYIEFISWRDLRLDLSASNLADCVAENASP